MKRFFLFLVIFIFLISCSDSDPQISDNNSSNEYLWTVSESKITGSFNPFPLAINPTFRKVNSIDFIAKESLVAIVSINNEIKVYPYQYISRFEMVNDKIDDINFTLTYCPITQSALCWDRNYNNDSFVLRASGYLFKDNLVAHDSKTDTYWSQILAECIKGKYAGETNKTYNFIETKWKFVQNFFPEALVFTNSSIANKSTNNFAKNSSITDLENTIFGIIDRKPNNSKIIHAFRYSNFQGETKLYKALVLSKKTLIIGNADLHFISAYTNDSNANFTTVQNEYPIIMKDDLGNKWNIFGVAVDGPRKGDQLDSPTNFVALYSAWQDFYENVNFIE